VTPSGDSRSTSTSERRLAAVAGGAPVNLLFTDASGKRFGFDAKGNRVSEIEGTILNEGRVQTYMLPRGAYKVTVAGTAKGSVAIRSDASDGVSTVRFAVKKGQKATVALKAGAPLGAFTIGGTKVKPVKGAPLMAFGLPKQVKAGRAWRARARIVDATGAPVAGAYIHVKDGLDGVDATFFADAEGLIDVWLPALEKGKSQITIRAPGRRTVGIPIRIVR
jgi:hypothetical protein